MARERSPEERRMIFGAVREAGQPIYDSVEDGALKWIVGDLLEGNCRWAVDNPGTIGEETLMRRGFTDNQMKWIHEVQAIVARAARADQLEKVLRNWMDERDKYAALMDRANDSWNLAQFRIDHDALIEHRAKKLRAACEAAREALGDAAPSSEGGEDGD